MQVFSDIRKWAQDKNLIDPALVYAQTVKLMEETGELAHGVARKDREEIADSIGDCIVVLTILAAQNNMSVEDCITGAFNVINKRRGKTVDGIFIKEKE